MKTYALISDVEQTVEVYDCFGYGLVADLTIDPRKIYVGDFCVISQYPHLFREIEPLLGDSDCAEVIYED